MLRILSWNRLEFFFWLKCFDICLYLMIILVLKIIMLSGANMSVSGLNFELNLIWVLVTELDVRPKIFRFSFWVCWRLSMLINMKASWEGLSNLHACITWWILFSHVSRSAISHKICWQIVSDSIFDYVRGFFFNSCGCIQ